MIETSVQCPYCGEFITIFVDPSEDEQTYTEDCSVCCRPIVFRVCCNGGELRLVEPSREG